MDTQKAPTGLLSTMILLSLLLNSCASNGPSSESREVIEVVKVKEAFDKQEKLLLSQIVNSVEYVPLETTEESTIGRNTSVFVDRDLIITVSIRQILVFDRKTGQFLREISGWGKGPEEYRSTMDDSYMPERGVIRCIGGSGKLMEFDPKGSLAREVPIPEQDGATVVEMSSGLYAQYFENLSGNRQEKILVFDRNGTEKHLFKNYNFYQRENPKMVIWFGREGEFYSYDSKTFFKEIWIDTLYQITDTLLIPRFRFDAGNMALKISVRGEELGFEKLKDLMRIEYMIETDMYLFFTVKHRDRRLAGYYDKALKLTKMSNYRTEGKAGFQDDLSGMMDFIPLSSNLHGELVGFVNAEVLIDHLTDNPQIEVSEHLKNLEIDDNPIVAIAKLK